MKSLPRPLIFLTQPTAMSALVALALTGLLYGDTLTLPLFSDDLVQIPWLESISWVELWSSPSPYGYYRPLWYTLWRVWGGIVGGLHPPGLHLLNVAAHFVAAWLAGLLAAAWIRSTPSEQRERTNTGAISAGLASALFVAFPFSRQAVAWPGAVYNPLVSAMAAGALLAYDRGRQNSNGHWIGLALLLAGLAPLTYEAGLLVGPLVILAEGLGRLQRRWPHRPRSWRRPLLFLSLFLATLTFWRAMRGAGVTGFGLNPSDLWHNVAYLVQGLIYPVAPLAQQLAARQGLDPTTTLWIIALPTLALLSWRGLRRNRAAFCLGTIWFALFALPPAVSMEADWFALAPRFLYMTAAGTSLVWAAALSDWGTRLQFPGRTVLTGALLAALVIPATSFVRKGVQLYAMAGESIWDVAQAAEGDQPLLLVNLPMRLTPQDRLYPLGFEGITPLPLRVTAEGLVQVHTDGNSAAEAVAFGIAAVNKPAGYTYRLFGHEVGWVELAAAIRQARTVYLTRYEEERIHLIQAGGPREPTPGEPMAHFRDHVTLLDAKGTCDEAGQVGLTAHWRVEPGLGTDVTIFVHLLDASGTVVIQADGYPLLGLLPFWLWEPGEVMRDVRHFDPMPPGEYTIRLGLWELATGEHWLATDHQDGVILLPVRCP
jgi:hypothetical protein